MVWKADDAVQGVVSPLDYKHMKLLRFALRPFGGWPGKELGDKHTLWFEGMGFAYYNTTLSIAFLISFLLYLSDHVAQLTFFELGHTYLVVLMNLVSTSRAATLCISAKYRAVARMFFRKIHLFYHKEKSDYSMEIHVKVHRFCHLFSIFLTLQMLFALLLFNNTPVINNYMAGKYKSRENLVNTTYEHSVYFQLPFNSESNFNGYIAAFILTWYGTYLAASSICMTDLILSLMVFHLWGHFKILLHLLATFPRPAAERLERNNGNMVVEPAMYSESENVLVAMKLQECIEYHLLILDFTNKISEAFGLALFVYLLFHQISGCLLLLECSQGNPQALARYVPFTVVMFQQLIQLSVIFETIGAMSGKLHNAVYCLPWELMDTVNRKTVLFYLINVQEPIHVHAVGIISVGVTTMASIFKTSLSYFAFLRTISE